MAVTGALATTSIGLGALSATAQPARIDVLPAATTTAVPVNAPGSPGEPSEPELIWEEDFEGDPAPAPIPLETYAGVDGAEYTASPYWLVKSECNGIVVQYDVDAAEPAACGSSAKASVRRMADVLGQLQEGIVGATTPTTATIQSTSTSVRNRAVAAFSQNGPAPAGQDVVFKTTNSPIVVSATSGGSAERFVTGSVDVAEISCDYSLREGNNSKLRFALVQGGTEKALTDQTIQPCTDSSSRYFNSAIPAGSGGGNDGSPGEYVAAGSYYSPAAVLLDPSASELDLIMRNNTLSGDGNDFAFNNVRLYDATPQLDKGFFPQAVDVNTPSTLTFTITNTTDLGEKELWGFTDNLPDGLVVAPNPNIENTCSADVTALAGAASITVGGGKLAQGTLSCEIKIDVTAAVADQYTNGAGNITAAVGIDFPGDATVTFEPVEAPAIVLTKTANLVNGDESVAGDTVEYDFVIENTGDVALTGVAIDDPLLEDVEITYANWPGAPGVLPVGGSVTATATYVLTQADVDTGVVNNTAEVVGTSPGGVVVTDADEATVTIAEDPSISITKNGAIDGQAEVGATVTYTFEVRNTGNVTLTGVTASDAKLDPATITLTGWAVTPGTLAPGATVTGEGTYVLTAADIEEGTLSNTATTEGTSPNGTPVDDESTHTIDVPAGHAIQLEKDAVRTETGPATAGELVTYNFRVTNIGNVTLTDVGITDSLAGLSSITFGAWPDAEGALAPGESVTASATYPLTQADIDAGEVVNTATATGTSRDGDVRDDDDATVTLPQAPQIALDKSGSLAGGPNSKAGDVVDYTFEVTNTGNVTLSGIVLDDVLVGLSNIRFEDVDADVQPTLAPGESITAFATYPLTQADVDRGHVDNTATAEGISPADVIVRSTDSAVVEVDAAASLEVTKTGWFTDAERISAGAAVTYGFTIVNTGDVTLSNVALTDDLPGLSGITYGTWLGDDGVLAPGQSVTATATYVLTQADVDRGGVDNTVVATGFTPQDPDQEDPVIDEDTHTLVVPDGSAIQLVKTGELAGDAAAGETVNYTFEVTNIGTTTLTGIAVTDNLAGLSDVTFGDWPADDGVLAPGERVTATASLTLTQEHLDNGTVLNTATVTGTDPSGDDVTDTDDVVVVVPPAAGIALVKEATLAQGATGAVGDVIDYAFTVTNTGNVTLKNVSITDALAGLGEVAYVWPGADGVLAPGESATASAQYRLTDDDVARGTVENTATAIGVPPTGSPVTDISTVTTELPDQPAAPADPSDSDDSDLAQTGANLLVPGLLGLVLLAAGAVLLVTLRTRRATQES